MSSKIEKAVVQMENWAKDDSHGYDQIFRWGENGDYDCSSSIIEALERAGIPVKSLGATYTENMYDKMLQCGFKDVTNEVNIITGSGIIRGDVLLNIKDHVAMSVGNGKLVQASINELGTVAGGQPGDQTGTEFYIRDYYNYPWDCVLRYVEAQIGANKGSEMVSKNDTVQNDKISYSGRVKKDTLCKLEPSYKGKNSSLFPVLYEGTLVDVIKGSAVKEEIDGNIVTWVLVKVAHPTEKFVKEYIQKSRIEKLSGK